MSIATTDVSKIAIVDRAVRKTLLGASLLETVVDVMEAVEKLGTLHGKEKLEYVIDVIVNKCNLGTNRQSVVDIVEIVIKLSKGIYQINRVHKFLGCF